MMKLRHVGLVCLGIFLATSLAVAQASRPAATAPIADLEYRRELLQLQEQSHEIRMKAMRAARDAPTGPNAVASYPPELLAEMREIDRRAQQRFAELVGERGFPTHSLVGQDAVGAAFAIMLQMPLDQQTTYLPMLEDAVSRNEAPASFAAHLTDRVRIGRGQLQIYGTQWRRDDTSGEIIVFEIEAADHVDARRAKVGLPPLEQSLEVIRKANASK